MSFHEYDISWVCAQLFILSQMTLGCELKANLDCIDLALLHSVNAVENVCQSLNQ